jgi:hypothetical protein
MCGAFKQQNHAIVHPFDRKAPIMSARRDFTYEEWSSLLQLYRHENAALADEMDRRFVELGVIERTVGGIGLSAAGKRLVEHELLMERRNRLQR